jgi:hypothetical protein
MYKYTICWLQHRRKEKYLRIIYTCNCVLLHNTVTSNAYLSPHRYLWLLRHSIEACGDRELYFNILSLFSNRASWNLIAWPTGIYIPIDTLKWYLISWLKDFDLRILCHYIQMSLNHCAIETCMLLMTIRVQSKIQKFSLQNSS